MLTLENIHLTLGKGTKLEYSVLKKLNVTVSPGEFVIVIGGNGAGKSTLFNVISGFLKPDSGKIILNHQDITHLSQKARAASISTVMQDPRAGTIENMTIFENMAFAYKRGQRRALCPFSSKGRKEMFQEKLILLNMGLENRLEDLVANLSGGQRQALSIIMAILAESKIVLLDEITAALDPKIAETVMQISNKLIRGENRTSFLITHNMSHALDYGDRIVLLKEGRFIKTFTAAEKKGLTPALLAAEFTEV